MTGWDRHTRLMNPVSCESFHLRKDTEQYYFKRGTPEAVCIHSFSLVAQCHA